MSKQESWLTADGGINYDSQYGLALQNRKVIIDSGRVFERQPVLDSSTRGTFHLAIAGDIGLSSLVTHFKSPDIALFVARSLHEEANLALDTPLSQTEKTIRLWEVNGAQHIIEQLLNLD